MICFEKKTDSLRLEGNDLIGSVPDSVCSVFEVTLPVFVTDCIAEIECECCLFCCHEFEGCTCQVENTELEFLCGHL